MKKMKNMVTFYNGYIHNRETKRPLINSTCFKCSESWHYSSKSEYTLVNILTNGGKYDTYVIKNNATGKISKTKRIAIRMTVSITDWSEKITAAISDNAGNIDFQELRIQLESSGINTITTALEWYDEMLSGNTESAHKLIAYMICDDFTGKMAGMAGISTSVKLNILCKLNQSCNGSVCEHCYAEKMRKSVAYKLALNTYVLCTHKFTLDEIPFLNYAFFRYESFSDLLNETQVTNYVNISLKNPHVKTALWTKRPGLLYAVLVNSFSGIKPENLSIVYSSKYLNVIDDIRENYILNDGSYMIDHIFTVWNAEIAFKKGIPVQCGTSVCIQCHCCYDSKTVYVNEILKAEIDIYMALINGVQS